MRWIAVALLAACGGSARVEAPASTSAMRWLTPQQPWHLKEASGGVLVAGSVVLVGGAVEGAIEKLDLVTGVSLGQVSLGKRLAISHMTQLTDGRYLISGESTEGSQVAVVDPQTFAATWFTLEHVPADPLAIQEASAVELADGTIAVGGKDVALTIYSARGEKLRELASGAWSSLYATKTGLVADDKSNDTYVFDLATGRRSAPQTGSVLGAHGDALIRRTYGKQGGVVIERAGRTLALPNTLGFSVHFDRDGSRFVSADGSKITVYSTSTGAALASFDVAPLRAYGLDFAFAGDKLVIASSGTLHVADMQTRSLTQPTAPFAPFTGIVVDRDGNVVAIGSEVWRFESGKLVSSAPIGRNQTTLRGATTSRYALRTHRWYSAARSEPVPNQLTIKAVTGRTIAQTQLARAISDAWIGSQGTIVEHGWSSTSEPAELATLVGKETTTIVQLHPEAIVEDVDIDGGLAAISLFGTVTLRETVPDGEATPIFMPECNEYGSAVLEHGGTRAATWQGGALIVWNRAGKALGSANFADTSLDGVTFVPGEREVIAQFPDHLTWWDPQTGAARTLKLASTHIAISSDRHYLAIAHGSGQVGMYDYAALRASATPESAFGSVKVPTACSPADPFDPHEPEADADLDAGDQDLQDDTEEHDD